MQALVETLSLVGMSTAILVVCLLSLASPYLPPEGDE